MNSTKSPNSLNTGDIAQYSDLTAWEDIKIIRVNKWKTYGSEHLSYDIRFLSDDCVLVDVDPSFIRPKKEK